MGYQREFDPEIGEESLRACLNDGALQGRKSYALSVSTSSASLTLPAGVYLVHLAGLSAAETVALATASSSASAVLPSAGTPQNAAVFAGSQIVRLRVQPDQTDVAAITAVGSGTLFFVPVVLL